MTRTRRSTGRLVGAGLLVALALACVVSFYASGSPDGLEKVAEDQGIAAGATDHDLADSPFADYGTAGIDDARASTAVAGAVGVGLTFLVFGGITYAVRRRPESGSSSPARPVTGTR